jgi:cobalt-zinc-cadmium efflux system outer membrane protein
MGTKSVSILLLGACALAGSLRAAPARAQDVTAGERAGALAADTITLSLSEAQRLALRQNPAFLADRQEAEIARGELRQARTYRYNPEVELEAPGSVSAGGVGTYEAAVYQELEWAGQWGLRKRAAELGLDRAESSVRNAARATLAEVSAAFYGALAAGRRLAVGEEVLALNRQLLDAVRTQVREGEISAMEANLAEIEVGRARARVLAARREQTTALLEVKRLVGLAPDRAVRLVEEIPDLPDPATLEQDSLVRLALSRRPDLAARTTAVEQYETLGRLARREAVPNLRVGAYADRDGVDGEPRFGVGVGLSLPFWNRNQGLVARREAQTRQATYARQATELRIHTEVADAYRSYLAASEEAEVYRSDVLNPARENQRLLETAYRAGKIDLPALLLLRNQLLEAELGYWDAWLAQRRAFVELEAATAFLDTPGDDTNDDDQR